MSAYATGADAFMSKEDVKAQAERIKADMIRKKLLLRTTLGSYVWDLILDLSDQEIIMQHVWRGVCWSHRYDP